MTESSSAAAPEPGRPIVFRGGTVLTMDIGPVRPDGCATCSSSASGSRRSAPGWRYPRARTRSTPPGGIVMPGMIDTHRHMWQTAMRGYGADWTLTQYFVWYYLEHGATFRPEDIHAGNLLSAIEALDAGVTTTVDWSHGLQTTDHADAAVDALRVGPRPVRPRLRQHPGRPVGVVVAAGVPRLRPAHLHPRRRPARLPDGVRRHRRPGVPRARRLRGRPRAGRRR